MLMVNPDGYFEHFDKLNAHKVNLNLNFATSNWPQYGSKEAYAGEVLFSEKESLIIKKAAEDYKPKMMISFHFYWGLAFPRVKP